MADWKRNLAYLLIYRWRWLRNFVSSKKRARAVFHLQSFRRSMVDDLERLQRLRDHIAQIIALGSLRPETISATKDTLDSLDRDIEAIKAKRVS